MECPLTLMTWTKIERKNTMDKKIDETITTLKDFKHATDWLNPEAQIYVQVNGQYGDDSVLIEITEVLLRLPKNEKETPYLILRTK